MSEEKSKKKYQRKVRYPDDLVPAIQHIPAKELQESLLVAEHEIYRFVKNFHLFDFDLKKLCVSVYLQGCLDGAQVQRKIDSGEVSVS